MIRLRKIKKLPYDESCYENETKVKLITHGYYVSENKLYELDLIKGIRIDSDGNYFNLIQSDLAKDLKSLKIKTLRKIKEENNEDSLELEKVLNIRKRKK